MHTQRGRCKNADSLASTEEVTAMRGLRGELNWTGRAGLLDGPGDASVLSSTLPKRKVKDLIEASAIA